MTIEGRRQRYHMQKSVRLTREPRGHRSLRLDRFRKCYGNSGCQNGRARGYCITRVVLGCSLGARECPQWNGPFIFGRGLFRHALVANGQAPVHTLIQPVRHTYSKEEPWRSVLRPRECVCVCVCVCVCAREDPAQSRP